MSETENSEHNQTQEVSEVESGTYETYVAWANNFRSELHPSLQGNIEVVENEKGQTAAGSPIARFSGKVSVQGRREPGVYVYQDVTLSQEANIWGFIKTSPDGTLIQGRESVRGSKASYGGKTSTEDVFDANKQKELVAARDEILKELDRKNRVRKEVNPFQPPSFD
jgi:hypothetical protein